LMKWLKCIVALGKSIRKFFNSEADGDSLLNRCPHTKDAKLVCMLELPAEQVLGVYTRWLVRLLRVVM